MAKRKAKQPTQADSADRHALYERAVQCAEAEIDFVRDTFKKLKKRPARTLREDFCATANICCEWVRRYKDNYAIGVDIDPEVLAWSREHRVGKLSTKQQGRVTLIEGDTLTSKSQPCDMLLATNFSYWLFKERKQLLNYLKFTRKNLVDDGVLFLDAYGGYDSFREIEEEREIEDGQSSFTYIWDQRAFNPINNNLVCHIHFAFADGSVMDKAFTYDWRLYTLPEICDLLHEAGFRKTTVYWQGWDENGEASGEFYPATKADADAGWICYIAAEK